MDALLQNRQERAVLVMIYIFALEKYGQTFGQMDPVKKNQISHRAVALQKLKTFLEEEH